MASFEFIGGPELHMEAGEATFPQPRREFIGGQCGRCSIKMHPPQRPARPGLFPLPPQHQRFPCCERPNRMTFPYAPAGRGICPAPVPLRRPGCPGMQLNRRATWHGPCHSTPPAPCQRQPIARTEQVVSPNPTVPPRRQVNECQDEGYPPSRTPSPTLRTEVVTEYQESQQDVREWVHQFPHHEEYEAHSGIDGMNYYLPRETTPGYRTAQETDGRMKWLAPTPDTWTTDSTFDAVSPSARGGAWHKIVTYVPVDDHGNANPSGCITVGPKVVKRPKLKTDQHYAQEAMNASPGQCTY